MRVRVLPLKDDSASHPVPDTWREEFCAIARALVERNYRLVGLPENIEPISLDSASQIEEYIADYGVTVVELPVQTWDPSCAQWMGSHWEVLVDLWSVEEGRSDLVLGAAVRESGEGYRFEVQLVYVP